MTETFQHAPLFSKRIELAALESKTLIFGKSLVPFFFASLFSFFRRTGLVCRRPLATGFAVIRDDEYSTS